MRVPRICKTLFSRKIRFTAEAQSTRRKLNSRFALCDLCVSAVKNSLLCFLTIVLLLSSRCHADADDQPPATNPTGDTRYFLGLLDTRSEYGKDFYPDLFLGPEFDRDTQLEVDYSHTESPGNQENEVEGEFDWNVVGDLTIEAAIGWDEEHQSGFGGDDGDDPESQTVSGFESVNLAAIHPVFQYVSPGGIFDYTAALRLDVSIPTRTVVSGDNVALTPWIANLVRIGNHFSLQAWAGSQFTIAPDQTPDLLYGVAFAYQIPHSMLPIPLVDSVIPLVEFDGQRPFTTPAEDALFTVIGLHFNFNSIGDAQPAFAVGYELPIDQGARNQLRWGALLQVFLEF